MTKVLYITIPSFFDLEISFVRELSKKADVSVLMYLPKEYMHTSAFSIDSMSKECGVILATDYPEFKKYSGVIDLDKWYIANLPTSFAVEGIKLSFKVKEFISHLKPDVVHFTSFSKLNILLTLLLPSGMKKILTVHDPVPHIDDRRLTTRIRRHLMFRKVNNVILLNRKQVAEFSEMYAQYKLNLYISSLSVYDYLLDIPKKEVRVDSPFILFVGRIAKYKGINHLIKAYCNSALPQQGIKLVVAGKGSFDFEVNKYEVNNSIYLINRFLEPEELAYLLDKSLYVVCPYIEATQSGVVMSAYAFSKPVIASGAGALPEMVEDNVTGMIVDPLNVELFAERLEAMTETGNLERFSNNIKQVFHGNGVKGWIHSAGEICSIYKKILQ